MFLFCKHSLVPEVPCLSVPACSVAVLDNHILFCTWNIKKSGSTFTYNTELQKYGLNYSVCGGILALSEAEMIEDLIPSSNAS